MEVDGAGFRLDPAAISCLRYRAQYGDSAVNHLERCATAQETQRVLLRLCHMMIAPEDRPELLEFARYAGRDRGFVSKARKALAALLAPDPRRGDPPREPPGERFDEYQILAAVAACGIDCALVYELPILHLAAVAERVARLKEGGGRTYRPMTGTEMSTLYPGRGKKRG